MIAPTVSADLLARFVDLVVLQRVRMVVDAHGLPELEDELVELLAEIRRPGDPEARPFAIRLILEAIRRHEVELAAEERALRGARAVAS